MIFTVLATNAFHHIKRLNAKEWETETAKMQGLPTKDKIILEASCHRKWLCTNLSLAPTYQTLNPHPIKKKKKKTYECGYFTDDLIILRRFEIYMPYARCMVKWKMGNSLEAGALLMILTTIMYLV